MRQTLLERKAQIEKKFDALKEQKADIDAELVRLQGEFRLCEELIAKSDETEPVEGEVVDANTITVQEPEE